LDYFRSANTRHTLNLSWTKSVTTFVLNTIYSIYHQSYLFIVDFYPIL